MSGEPPVRSNVLREHLRCTTAIRPADWDRFVDTHPEATAYHAWDWRRVFEEAFGHETVYLAALGGDRVVGVLPTVVFRSWLFGRFMVSLPFVNYGGVLAGTATARAALLGAAQDEAAARGCSHVELRHVDQMYPALPVKRHKVAMKLALAASPTAEWDRLDRKVRNQVRKAQKSDLDVVSGGPELLDGFYKVFSINMRDLGTPVYSQAFFEAVLTTFPERARLLVVRHGNTAVAAALTFRYRDTLEVPWASSLRSYRASCPNNLLYWTAIERAIESGCRTFDFGRSTPGEGTYEFKRQWGAVASPVNWEYALLGGDTLPDQSPTNPRFRQAIALWKRLPVGLTTLVGPSIVRAIP
jgi:FemAB-related protein (PEP-CTERM system-associated)